MQIKRILILISIFIVFGLSYLSYNIYKAVFSPNTAFQKPTQSFFVSNVDNMDSVIIKITPLLKDIDGFYEVAKRKNYKPQSGHFVLKKDMNNNEIINVLRSQNTPVNITFNNAENIAELSGKLGSQLDSDSLKIFKVLTDATFLLEKDLTVQQSLSLYIPNTYEFYWDEETKAIQKRLLAQYEIFWNSKREKKRKALNLSRLEVSILASIVQKETTKTDERPKVAGVYINRLRLNMKLQADPTVVFALKQKYNNPDTIIRRVLKKDLEIDSPYNTYKNFGLPPAPLIMPDISSIDAVLNYEKHNFLYFVASTKQPGYHEFSRSLRAHNQKANIYRDWISKRKIFR